LGDSVAHFPWLNQRWSFCAMSGKSTTWRSGLYSTCYARLSRHDQTWYVASIYSHGHCHLTTVPDWVRFPVPLSPAHKSKQATATGWGANSINLTSPNIISTLSSCIVPVESAGLNTIYYSEIHIRFHVASLQGDAKNYFQRNIQCQANISSFVWIYRCCRVKLSVPLSCPALLITIGTSGLHPPLRK